MEARDIVASFRRELPWLIRCSEKTSQISADHVRLFLEHEPDPFPECLSYARVVAWLDYLAASPPRRRDKARREPSTVNGHLKSLKRFAKWAVARGYVERDPIAGLKGVAEQDRIILAPEPETVALVLAAARACGSTVEMVARNVALISTLIDIGPRAGELVAMDISDVADITGAVRDYAVIHGKGGKERMVALNPLVRAALSAYLPLRRSVPGEHALWLTASGQRITYVAIRGAVKRICRIAGVDLSPHDFRRFALTEMWMLDMDRINGMLLSGHSSQRVFERYIRGGLALRALREHRARSPLENLSAAKRTQSTFEAY